MSGPVARLVYYLVITPAGLLSRLFADPLRMRRAPAESAWRPLAPADTSLDSARRQS